MKSPKISELVLIALGLVLGGCASAPNLDIDKVAATQVKRIAVLGVHEPRNVQVANIGGAAAGFGPIGGLIQGSTNADHSKQFLAVLAQQKTSFAVPLQNAVVKFLTDDGIAVSLALDQKPKLAADGKSDDYSDIHVNADAILNVWFGVVGYMSSPYSTHYEPWIVVSARLLDAKTGKDIYRKMFCVGYKMKIEGAVFLPADPKYRYSSFDDLMAHSNEAITGILSCEEIAVKQIATDLKLH